jgi:hypothetical protein
MSPFPRRGKVARRAAAGRMGEESGLIQLGLSLFDQHHGDPVDDRIEDLALRTAELVGLLELHLGVAFRARQDFQQFLRDHPRMVVRFGP